MRLFVDTANVDEIREAASWGVVSGVTTNPSLMSKNAGRSFRDVITEIASIVDGPISAEVTSTDPEEMVREGTEIAAWHPNVVIKVPIIPNGLKAAKVLVGKGVRVNMTLCFSVNQALLAAAAGATFVSPFVGRLDDIGNKGMEVVADIVDVYERYGIPTQVIAASLRHPAHVVAAALAGSHIATIPYPVMMQMVKHPLTDNGLAAFMRDWEKFKQG
ncbi:MAG: fructose-6-phosphate aldolase [Bacteroidetes bacterium]|nr:fructose-6-phosphate aldolase [Bacteroidota bacterium]MCL5025166.1 fructose-6-phosphate aldolase [Chloroflexota bacterium]